MTVSIDAVSIDTDAGLAMWREYVASFPDRAVGSDEPEVSCFGDSPEMADRLLDFVLSGAKRATASLLAEYIAEGEPTPSIGSHWVVCDGEGRPRAILRVHELRIGLIDSVDDAFAWDEGEYGRTRELADG